MVTEREAIDIAIIAIYIPSIVAAVFVSIRHGFVRQLGWVYLLIFCALRIAGGAVGILSVHNPKSISDAEWAAILSSVGLSPLLLASMGLLQRVNEFIETASFRVRVLQILHIPCILALVLAIIGGTDLGSTDTSKHSTGQDLAKAGGIVFLLTYLGLLAVAALTLAFVRNLPWGEKRILFAVTASLPFLAVRLLYSILTDFAVSSNFSIFNGNVTVQLCMAIIEEFIVVVIYLIVGMIAPSLKSAQLDKERFPLQSGDVQHANGAASAAYQSQSWGRTPQA